MKIAVIGANGKAGTLITKEALSRGHEVTAIVRSESAAVGAKVVNKDLFNLTYEETLKSSSTRLARGRRKQSLSTSRRQSICATF